MSVQGVSMSAASLKDNRLRDYAVRFAFGGTITVIAGLVGDHYGAALAGLLMAFPAIFPASITLLADHEKLKMRRAGKDGTMRGREAAAVDAEGTALACVGLALFAFTAWRMLPIHNLAFTLFVASAAWLVVSVTCWEIRRRF